MCGVMNESLGALVCFGAFFVKIKIGLKVKIEGLEALVCVGLFYIGRNYWQLIFFSLTTLENYCML
jgi:hypothetical protein